MREEYVPFTVDWRIFSKFHETHSIVFEKNTAKLIIQLFLSSDRPQNFGKTRNELNSATTEETINEELNYVDFKP